MADIQQFIQMATSNLGVTEDTAKSATGGLLGFLGDKLPSGDYQSLLGELPGAADLAPAGGDEGGGGLLGGVTKLAGGAIGGKLGAAAGIVGALTKGGLDVGQVGGFVTQFLGFAKDNVSGGLLDRILTQVPDLKNVIE